MNEENDFPYKVAERVQKEEHIVENIEEPEVEHKQLEQVLPFNFAPPIDDHTTDMQLVDAEELIRNSQNFYMLVQPPWRPEPKYDPAQLWNKFIEYMEWNKANPLYAAKWDRGNLNAEPRMRAMTELAFTLFAGLNIRTFENYKTGDVGAAAFGDIYKQVALRICSTIRTQKFEGASADLLNANIIAKDLGLVDKKQIEGNLNLGTALIEFE
jgi:hypothetical protein